MKYNVGDKVRIRSLDWYNENKNKFGKVWTSGKGDEIPFDKYMSNWCGKVMTISDVRADHYTMIEDLEGYWTDEMIECKVEDNKYFQDYMNSLCKEHDEMIEGLMKDGTIIDYVKESNDRYKIVTDPRFYIEVDEGEYYAVRRKKEYPKTYKECREIMGVDTGFLFTSYDLDLWKGHLLSSLQKLLICLYAYWKIAGEEMGLGRPWEPLGRSENVYAIVCTTQGEAIKQNYLFTQYNYVLTFPTEEMRDAFYENFKEDIEECKELL